MPPTVHSNRSERLVVLENYSGWLGADVRFLFLSLLPTPPPKREYNAVPIISDETWEYRTGGNLTVFNKGHDTLEDGSRTIKVLAAKHRHSLRFAMYVVAIKRDLIQRIT